MVFSSKDSPPFTVCCLCSLELPNLNGQVLTWKNISAVNRSVLLNDERKHEKTAVSSLRWPYCCFRTILSTRNATGFFISKKPIFSCFSSWDPLDKTSSRKKFQLGSLTRRLLTTGILSAFQLLGKTFQKNCHFICLLNQFFYIFCFQKFLFLTIFVEKSIWVFPDFKKMIFFRKIQFFSKKTRFCTFFEELTFTFAFWAKFASIFSQKIDLKITQLASNCRKSPVVRGWSSHYKWIRNNPTVPLST